MRPAGRKKKWRKVLRGAKLRSGRRGAMTDSPRGAASDAGTKDKKELLRFVPAPDQRWSRHSAKLPGRGHIHVEGTCLRKRRRKKNCPAFRGDIRRDGRQGSGYLLEERIGSSALANKAGSGIRSDMVGALKKEKPEFIHSH
jgi:hypothetical protein